MAANLHPKHYAELHEGSGISPEVIAARGVRTCANPAELRALGLPEWQAELVPAMLLPIETMNGWEPTYAIKPDKPRTEAKPDGRVKVRKYEYQAGAPNHLDCPAVVRDVAADPSVPLLITEGWKKVMKAITDGYHCIGLGGVWNWLGKSDTPFGTLLQDFGYINWKGRKVAIVFDSDVATNKNVREARKRLRYALLALGCSEVLFIDLPTGPGGSKQGLDDYLVANPGAALWDMAYDPDDAKAAKDRQELAYAHRLQSANSKALACRGAKYVPVLTRFASAVLRMKQEGKPPATEDGLYYVSKAAIGGRKFDANGQPTDDWDIKEGTVKNHLAELRQYADHIPGFRAEKRLVPFPHREIDQETGEVVTVERYEETWIYDLVGGPAEILEILPTLPYPEETRGGKRCPKCGSQKIRRVWHCDDCKATFEHPAQDIAPVEEGGANFAPIGNTHTDSPTKPMGVNPDPHPARADWDSLYERAEKATRAPIRPPGQTLTPPPEVLCPGCKTRDFCTSLGYCPLAEHLRPPAPKPPTIGNQLSLEASSE